MQLTIANKEDANNWNKVIHRDSESLFFDRFEWIQALGYAFDNITPLPLIIKEKMNIIGVLPACINKGKFYSTIESLPFSDYGGGPFFRKQNYADENFHTNLIKNLIKISEQHAPNCVKISIRRSYFENLIKLDTIPNKIDINDNNCSFIIDLSKNMDYIVNNMKVNRLRSIKKGKKYNIKFREGVTIDDLDIFHQIYSNHMYRIKVKPLSYAFLEYLWKHYAKNEEIKLIIGEDDKIIGGILVLNYKGISHAWACGILEEARKKNLMDLLILHSIEWAHKNNFNFFDLGSTVNDPSSGHYFYKDSWGGMKRALFNYQIIIKPILWKLYNNARRLIQ